ncbi:MAG: phosphatase PAP2 family protein, partial [Acidobacteriota bacterium]
MSSGLQSGNLADGRARLHDLASVGYLGGLAVLLALFGGDVPGRAYLIGLHLLWIGGILALVRLAGRSRWLLPARVFYPLPLLLFAWNELDALIPMLYGSYWGTDWIVRLDRALFGAHPTVWVQRLYRPWLDELMAILYSGYYLFLAVPVVLWARGKRRAAMAAMGLISIDYFTNFTAFLLLPTKSPPQILAEYPSLRPSDFDGYWIASATRRLQESESVTGAAFPSSHVSGSVVCTLAALRWEPRLGRVLAPLALGVAVATVYLGYHHAVDP